jgi:hypothetical protein
MADFNPSETLSSHLVPIACSFVLRFFAFQYPQNVYCDESQCLPPVSPLNPSTGLTLAILDIEPVWCHGFILKGTVETREIALFRKAATNASTHAFLLARQLCDTNDVVQLIVATTNYEIPYTVLATSGNALEVIFVEA